MMNVSVSRVTDWKLVSDAARYTVGKHSIGHEPSDAFKSKMLISQHSPIRLLQFRIEFTDVPYYVMMHLVRHHVGIEKFVSTQRDDRTECDTPRSEKPQGSLVNAMFVCNAESLLCISRVRLCAKADPVTRKLWSMVREAIRNIDPLMARYMVPSCVYRGICPEKPSCGYVSTPSFLSERLLSST